MQALSPPGLADSYSGEEFESASPSTSLSDKSRPSQSRISHISDAYSLAVLAIVILDLYGSTNLPDSLHRIAGGDRAAVDLGSTSTVPAGPSQWGVGRGVSWSPRPGPRCCAEQAVRAEAGPHAGPDPTGGSCRRIRSGWPDRTAPSLLGGVLGVVLGGGHNHER